MNNAFPRLLKVLSLERQLGYRNKAVIGGLDKFASRWEVDARAEAPDAPQVGEIISLLIGYPAVEDTAARERIIEEILRHVARDRAHPDCHGGTRYPTAPGAGRAWGLRTVARRTRSRSPVRGHAIGGRTDWSGAAPRKSQRAHSAGNHKAGANHAGWRACANRIDAD